MGEISVNKNENILNSNLFTFNERQDQLNYKIQKEKDEINRSKNSPFNNFYQFNRKHSKEMIWLAKNHPKAQAILLFLLDQMDNYNAIVCSYKVFQEALDISESTAKRAVKILKEANFITVYKTGTTNVYVVNKTLAWSSWGTNYKYAKFDAKIIISENEQESKK